MAKSTSTTPDPAVFDTNITDVHLKASTQVLNLAEIREMIMLHMDPLSMLRLVLVSEAALVTFKQYSTKLLNSTLAIINVEDNAGTIPVAIVEATKTRLDDYEEDELEKHHRLGIGAEKVPTNLDIFLNEFVKKGHWRFSGNVQKPLDSLRRLAVTHEAVEILVNSPTIWTCIRNHKIGDNTQIQGRPFSKREEIRRILWVYQLHCTLYHRSGTAGHGEVLFPSTNSQSKYIELAKEQGVLPTKLVNVYRDLSSFLGKLYEEDWARFFHDNFKHYSKYSQDLIEGRPMTRYKHFHPNHSRQFFNYDHWSDRKVVQDTQCDFYQYIHYQMSLGLTHLAEMYRLSLKPKPVVYPVQKYWTDSFFTCAFQETQYRRFGQPDVCLYGLNNAYLLEPLEGGKDGYKLTITVPSTKGHYLLQVAKPLFADEEFKPTHLGRIGDLVDSHTKKSVEEKVTQEEVLRVGPHTPLEPHMVELLREEHTSYARADYGLNYQRWMVKRMRRS